LAISIELIRHAHPNQLMDSITHLNFNIITFAGYPDISLSQFTKQIQGMSSLLPQGQAKRILLTTLFYRFLNISCQTVKTVCWTSSVNTLVGALMIIVGDPMAEPLTGIGKGGKDGISKKFFPYSTPEPLDLAQGHRVMRSTANMLYSLTVKHFLEFCFASPSNELPTVI
jgi:hypothetical protein